MLKQLRVFNFGTNFTQKLKLTFIISKNNEKQSI